MTIRMPLNLLDVVPIASQHIEIHDRDSFAAAMLQKIGAKNVRIDPAETFSARSSRIAVDGVELLFNEVSAEFTSQFPEMDCVRLMLPLKGGQRLLADRDDLAITAGQFAVISSGRKVNARSAGGGLALRASTELLMRRFIAETGARPAGTLTFDTRAGEDDPHVASLRRMVHALAAETSVLPEPSPVIIGSLRDAIASGFLRLSRTTRELGDDVRVASHAQARLVADYIEANADRYVAFEELAALSNVSLRSLFRAFKAVYGCTPMAFAKQQRLTHARKLLSDPATASTVLSVAYKLGFGNPSHFARDYEALFGELPSETLRRTKG